MRTTKTTLFLLIQETETDAPEASGVITTPGELVRARPIRNIRPEPVEAFRPKSPLARLDSWLRRVS